MDKQRPVTAAQRTWSYLAVMGGIVGVLAAVAGAGAGLSYRSDLLALREAFELLRWAAYGGAAGAALSIAGLVRTWPGSSRRGFWVAMLGLVTGAATFGLPYSHYRLAKKLPPIHDITTDTRTPPQFRAVLPLRGDAANSLEYGGEAVAAQQRDAYPDIRPLVTPLPHSRVFEAVLETAMRSRWEVVDSSPVAGRLEAVDSTPWFGFRDDVVVRVTDQEGGTRVDVRSVSRVGVSDVGRNAQRIRNYLNDLRSRIGSEQ